MDGRRGPIDPERLGDASPALVQRQIRWQLAHLREAAGFTQEKIGLALNRAQSFVSRLESGSLSLSLADARLLDEFAPNTEDHSFEDLVLASARARRDRSTSRRGVRPRAFVASPMSVPTGTYAESRNLALDLVHVLRDRCDFDVYYAGENLPTVEDFDAADIAYEANLSALDASSLFILLWEGPPPAPTSGTAGPKNVSSIWVEAGMALTFGLASTYFVPDLTALPYILQQASKHNSTAPVTVRPFGNDPRRAIDLVRSNGARLFSQ